MLLKKVLDFWGLQYSSHLNILTLYRASLPTVAAMPSSYASTNPSPLWFVVPNQPPCSKATFGMGVLTVFASLQPLDRCFVPLLVHDCVCPLDVRFALFPLENCLHVMCATDTTACPVMLFTTFHPSATFVGTVMRVSHVSTRYRVAGFRALYEI
jgi:hypothetical protein